MSGVGSSSQANRARATGYRTWSTEGVSLQGVRAWRLCACRRWAAA